MVGCHGQSFGQWRAYRSRSTPNSRAEIHSRGDKRLSLIGEEYTKLIGSGAEPSIAELSWEDVTAMVQNCPLCDVGKLDTFRRLGYNVAQEEINAMPDNSVVRARIDDRTKREAAAALKKIGLTVSDAFRLLLVRVAAEKALPFEPLNPNAETIAAMKAARRGELVKAGKPDKLLRSLNAGR